MAKTLIVETTDYKQFKDKKGNRPITPGHVTNLVNSIKKSNLLAANPIIVNRKMEIIDGQHRLKAAQVIGVPINYVIFDPASLVEIQMLNATVRNWKNFDFMNSYIAMGKEDYKIFKEFWERYDFTFNPTMVLLNLENFKGLRLNQKFREGDFKVTSLNEGTEIANRIEELLNKNKFKVKFNSNLYRSLIDLIVKYPDLFDQLEMKVAEGKNIYRMDAKKDYYRQFEDILNYKNYGKSIRLF